MRPRYLNHLANTQYQHFYGLFLFCHFELVCTVKREDKCLFSVRYFFFSIFILISFRLPVATISMCQCETCNYLLFFAQHSVNDVEVTIWNIKWKLARIPCFQEFNVVCATKLKYLWLCCRFILGSTTRSIGLRQLKHLTWHFRHRPHLVAQTDNVYIFLLKLNIHFRVITHRVPLLLTQGRDLVFKHIIATAAILMLTNNQRLS